MDWVTIGLGGIGTYVDDVFLVGDIWKGYLDHLHLLIGCIQNAGFSINLHKDIFGRGTVEYLGHTVGGGLLRLKEVLYLSSVHIPLPEPGKK